MLFKIPAVKPVTIAPSLAASAPISDQDCVGIPSGAERSAIIPYKAVPVAAPAPDPRDSATNLVPTPAGPPM